MICRKTAAVLPLAVQTFVTLTVSTCARISAWYSRNRSFSPEPSVRNISITKASQMKKSAMQRRLPVDESILHFTDGYDTIVGEAWRHFLVGQKQRVAIARMLMKEAPILYLTILHLFFSSFADLVVCLVSADRNRRNTGIGLCSSAFALITTPPPAFS